MRALQRRLLAWYEENRRDLPWRRTTDPYAILVSEIMLQQTQVSRVAPRFLEWLEAWPTLESLAGAPLADVLQRWQGLGYNNRARRLQECARGGRGRGAGRRPAPSCRARSTALRALPGIGPYTARAVLVFAHNDDLAAVDANVRRVLTHELGLPGDLADAGLQAVADAVLPRGRSRDWHNALMDYGVPGADGARHRHRAAHAADRVRGITAAEAIPPAAARCSTEGPQPLTDLARAGTAARRDRRHRRGGSRRDGLVRETDGTVSVA